MPSKKINSKQNTRTKKTGSKKRNSRKTKQPKVYIPAYKIIMLCAFIIAICTGLLLFTTVKEPSDTIIAKRYDNKKTEITEEKKQPENKTESNKKNPQPQSKPVKKTEKPAAKESPKVVEKTPVQTSTKSPEKTPEKEPEKSPEKTPEKAQEKTPEKSRYNFPEAKNHAQLIFVFDDGGQNLNHLKQFLKLPFPITIAVLPQLVHSVESANQIRNSGNELMLHQPMQSIKENINPGPGAITPAMTEDQIISTLFTNINEIGPIAGMNNHEGSGITADAEKMAVILRVSSENGIYFLDSRTNVETKVPYVAKELGYSYYQRDIFLDNEKTKENALKELEKGLTLANKNGSVIMIGHIWSADFLPEFLQEVYPELVKKGYTFSTVSKSKALKGY